ncbi:hypothetical protein [Alcanivorax xiamenensis]|nr:hypothetical protein [Alcanivorax xiamenensis]
MLGRRTKQAGMGLAVLVASLSHGEETMPAFPDETAVSWRVLDDGVRSRTPDALRIPVVTLDPGRLIGSERAYILVQAPYGRVWPVVAEALADHGVVFEQGTPPLYSLEEPWLEVLLSRNGEWRALLSSTPEGRDLDAAVADGALTAEERTWRRHQARARTEVSRERLSRLPVAQAEYARAESVREWTQGRQGKQQVTLTVTVFDAGAVFGTTATVIDVFRDQRFPNPDYPRLWAADGVPTLFSQSLVPADLFGEVMRALDVELPGAARRLSDTPSRWHGPVAPPPGPVEPGLRYATQSDLTITPEIHTLASADPFTPKTLQALANGSLAIGVERAALLDGEQGWIAELWHLMPREQRLEVLWQGWQGVDSLFLDPATGALWFRGDKHWFRFRSDQQGARPVSLSLPAADPDARMSWQLDSHGHPRLCSDRVDRIYRYREQKGGKGHYAVAEVPRAAFFSQPPRPVLWQGDAVWVQDQYGMAELDPASGRVARVIRAPQRSGRVFDEGTPEGSVSGDVIPPWPAVGSPSGQWVTGGFRLHRGQGESEAPLVGLHVFDTARAEYLYSAVLDGQSRVSAVAASAEGWWLAMAAGNHVQLWEARTGRTPITLNVPTSVSVTALSFAPDGGGLYALTGSSVLHWRLPSL